VTFKICGSQYWSQKSSHYCYQFLIEKTAPRTAPLVDSLIKNFR
jgi:hypothetical protein